MRQLCEDLSKRSIILVLENIKEYDDLSTIENANDTQLDQVHFFLFGDFEYPKHAFFVELYKQRPSQFTLILKYTQLVMEISKARIFFGGVGIWMFMNSYDILELKEGFDNITIHERNELQDLQLKYMIKQSSKIKAPTK
jgi:hypothetical protein